MMTLDPIKDRVKAAHYFEKDNYYLKDEGIALSNWYGKGAQELGLKGKIDTEKFAELLSGLVGGKQMGRVRNGVLEHHPGFDATFNAPKSVSILALVFGDKDLLEAHKKASQKALDWFESKAAITRLKIHEKVRHHHTGNFIIGQFQHDTNRELEPHLHTHSVIFNATLTKRGPRSLDSRMMYKLKVSAGQIYQNELANAAIKLGYSIRKVKTSRKNSDLFEIKEVPEHVLDAFSQRTQKVREYLKSKGLKKNAINAQLAVLRTRPKKKEVDRKKLKDMWLDKCKSLEYMPSKPEKKSDDAVIELDYVALRKHVFRAIKNVSYSQMAFSYDEILKDALNQVIGRSNYPDLKMVLRQLEREKFLVKTAYRDKLSGKLLYTTSKNLKEEKKLAELISGSVREAPFAFKDKYVLKKLKKTFLSEEQKHAVYKGLSGDDRYFVFQGLAGSGKTTALRELVKIAKKNDVLVEGFAPTHVAKKELEISTGIESNTIISLLSRKKQYEAKQKKLWLVDESGMLSIQDMNRLLSKARDYDAKVILVGDRKQLDSIGAGRAYDLIQKFGVEKAEVKKIVRQKREAVNQAVKFSSEGLNKEALNILDLMNGLTEVPNSEQRIEEAVHSWHQKWIKGQDVMILTASNKERREVNKAIRKHFSQEGQLSGEELKTYSLFQKHFTPIEKRQAHNYDMGDYIKFSGNYEKEGIDKDSYYKVVGINYDDNLLHLKSRSDGKRLSVNPNKTGGNRKNGHQVYELNEIGIQKGDKLRWKVNSKELGLTNNTDLVVSKVKGRQIELKGRESGEKFKLNMDKQSHHHFDHAYADTVYTAQGKTCDHVVMLADSKSTNLIHEASVYVGISRPRYGVDIFTDSVNELKEALLLRSGKNRLATDAKKIEEIKQEVVEKRKALEKKKMLGLPKL